MRTRKEKKNMKKLERTYVRFLKKCGVKTIIIDGDSLHKSQEGHRTKWQYEPPEGLAYFGYENGKMLTPEFVYQESVALLPELISGSMSSRLPVRKLREFFSQAMATGTMVI